MNFHIVVIPHSTQRYETVGDYWIKAGEHVEIRVSDFLPVTIEDNDKPYNPTDARESVSLSNKYEFLVAVHEMVECFLCREAGITIQQIDNFDLNYSGPGEPGDAEDCPYRMQHQIATAIEKELAGALGVSWQQYDEAVNKLTGKPEQETSST